MHNPETRSYNMSMIRGKDTKPEVLVRRFLFSKGLRFRKNDRRYPGHPDIVLPKYHCCIFVNGCFWHQHPGCRYAVLPKTHTDYWLPKLKENTERDQRDYKLLQDSGWNVIIVWECELKKDKIQKTLDTLYSRIISCN